MPRGAGRAGGRGPRTTLSRGDMGRRGWPLAVAGLLALAACSSGTTAEGPPASTGVGSTSASAAPSASDASGPSGPSEGSIPAGPSSGSAEPTNRPTGSAASGEPDRTCPTAAELTPRQRLQQLIMIWVDGGADTLPGVVTNEDVLLGGVFVGGGDAGLESGLFTGLAGKSVPPLVAVDEEGGQVQRIDAIAGDIPSARDQARTMSVREVEALARERGQRLAALGVTIDFAPVVDLDDGPVSRVIGERSYSADPDTATAYAGAFARGLQDAGIIPTLKHFPGHGRAEGDSHAELPIAPPLASLQAKDLKPYAELLSTLPEPVAVMVGHLRVPGLTTGDTPTSLDPATYRYLRTTIGFHGLVVTDELSGMQAVSDQYSTPAAVKDALAAGADLALLAQPGDLSALLDYLEAAVASGDLPESRVLDAAEHVLAVKTCPAT